MAEIEGTVTLDSVAAEVPVIALAKVGGEYQILDSTISAPDGTYGLDPGAGSFVIALGGNAKAHGAVAAGALWTPAEITTALWLDAADAGTITEVSGAVSQWDDKSGNDRHATEVSSGSGADYQETAVNGMPALYGNGTSTRMQISGPVVSGASDRTVIAVKQFTGTKTTDTLLSLGFNNLTTGSVFQMSPEIAIRIRNGNRLFASSAPTGTHCLVGFASTNGAASGLQAWINGSSLSVSSTAAASLNTAGNSTLFYKNNVGGSELGEGWICEVVVLAESASTATRQLIEGYLAWKWGLRANLPSGHPYKDAAPTV